VLCLYTPTASTTAINTGPIGAAAQLCNTVVTSAGASVTLYEWDPRTTQLKPVGIYEASQYVVTMSVARNYLLLGDAVNSVQFMCWRDEDRSLNMVNWTYY
jgi:CPSF A subunit region